MKCIYPMVFFLFSFCFSIVVSKAQCISPFSNALNFDGVDDHLTVQSGVYFNGDFTIEAWVKPDDFGNWSRIIDFSNGAGSNGVILASTFGVSGAPGFFVNGTQFQASKQLTLHQWNHVAATLKGSVGIIYVNGEFAGSQSMNTPANVTRTLNYIGKSAYGPGDAHLNGTMDELRIWSVAKTQAQIQAGLNHELAGNETNLVLYYNFNQGIAGDDNTAMTQLNDQTTGIAADLQNFALNGSTSNLIADDYTIVAVAPSLNPQAVNSPICTKATTDIFANKSGGGNNPSITWYTKPNGGGTIAGTGDMINKGTGTYYARFTSECSLPMSIEAKVVVLDNKIAISSNYSTTPTTCYGSTNGTLAVNATSGVSPYMYTLGTTGAYPSATGSYSTLKAGTYSANIQDANGCVGKITGIVITQPQAVTIQLSKTDETCAGKKDGTILASGTGGQLPYLYKFGTTGGYSTTNTFSSLKPGSYRVYIQDANGCGNRSQSISIVGSLDPCNPDGKAINDLSKSAIVFSTGRKITTYPNPAVGSFSLQLNNFKARKATVTVISESGLIIEHRNMTINNSLQSTVYFNMVNKPAGLYFVKVTTEEGVQVSKVILRNN
jgi:hypothetical protein